MSFLGEEEPPFWISGVPDTELVICIFLWLLLLCCTIILFIQASNVLDFVYTKRQMNGLVHVPEYQQREWAEETKYYTEAKEDGEAETEKQKESRAQITSRVGLLTNELPSNC